MKSCFTIALLLLCLAGQRAQGTIHTIVDAGFTFSPAALTIAVGDTVNFTIGGAHNVVEVSFATWNANGNTSNGGFQLPFGGGQLIFPNAGTYYYVCSPHAGMGMKGQISVVSFAVTTGSIAPTSFCGGSAVQVPFTVSGTFNGSNVFTAQLSDAFGSFSAPVQIGTLAATGSGTINATIPAGTPVGSGYRIRVMASSPAVTGSNNGTNLSVLGAPAANITAAGPTSFCQGGSVMLDANTGPGLTHTWFLNGSQINGATSASYQATQAGLYTVTVSNGACSTTSTAERVVVYTNDPTRLTWTGAIDGGWSTVGNWDNPCAVPGPGDTVVISGTMTPPTSTASITLSRLLLSNPHGLTLSSDLVITGELTLNGAMLTLGAAQLTIAQSGSISGAGASSFIVTNGSGSLRQQGIGSGGRGGTVLFPVGSAPGSYTPVLLANIGTADEFRVSVRDGVQTGGTGGGAITDNVVLKTWTIDEAQAGGSLATITLQWTAADEGSGFDRTQCYIARHDGAAWTPQQSLAAASASPHQRTVSGIGTFSPFAVGDGASPLPVTLRLFEATEQHGIVLLRWESTEEYNNAGFFVQRSRTGKEQWSDAHFVPAAGGNAGARYEQRDTPPTRGRWLYRLRQVDIDGTEHFSSSVAVDVALSANAAMIHSLYPNPLLSSSMTELRVEFGGETNDLALLTLENILGQEVARLHDGAVRANERMTVRFGTASLQPGVYLLRLRVADEVATRRLVLLR